MDQTSLGEIVEAGWQRVREDGRVRTELLEVAYAEPRLRELFPWTGMGELHFSGCTEHPWTWNIPYILPVAGGTYCVAGPRRTEMVGRVATAQQAVALVVSRLPPGLVPVFVGDQEELAASGETRRPEPNDR
jgi:hypothetical protein